MKTVTLELVGLDGNAFAILGAFQRQARREKWTPDEIKEVMDNAKSGDYNHLLSTIMNHCESPVEDDDEYDDEDQDDSYGSEDDDVGDDCDEDDDDSN